MTETSECAHESKSDRTRTDRRLAGAVTTVTTVCDNCGAELNHFAIPG